MVHKPLTVGSTSEYIQHKIAYLSSIAARNKVVILAGSNGRFSHRCEVIERIAKAPCANMSIAAGLNLVWQFEKIKPYLKPGDILYLPLEYRDAENDIPLVGNEAPYIVAYDKRSLGIYSPIQLGHALFYFDLKYLFSAIGEMVLSSVGIERRFSHKTMTIQGDESGHTEQKGAEYREFIKGLESPVVDERGYADENNWKDLIEILNWASNARIRVVGGLPTTFIDARIPENVFVFLAKLYVRHGHCFLALPNKSVYSRANFFDTAYHLNERAQEYHSIKVAEHLSKIIHNGKCSGD